MNGEGFKENDRSEWYHSLKDALENQELFLCYQPLVDVKMKKIVCLEALVRWRKPGNKIVSPNDFIPMAEETNLIVPIGEWVLETACRQLKSWQEQGIICCNISVNISVLQLKQPHFARKVFDIITMTNLSPEYLELEITESSYMGFTDTIAENVKRLKDGGIKVSLDDFGTGYNNMKNIQNIAIDSLKIDRSFISNIYAEVNKAIVESIILLGRRIHAQIIAEGVETIEQFEYLESVGCNTLQGYYFSHPLVTEEVPKIFLSNVTTHA